MNKQDLSLVYDTNVKRQADEKRKFNIIAFSALDRSGLEFRKVERRLYIYNTSAGEKIWIQYPGKETLTGKPWDFRPKMYMQATGEFMPDLAFPDIWDDLADIHTGNPEALQVLAAVLFRMAYMEGYAKETRICEYDDVNVETSEVINHGEIEITFYVPKFNSEIILALQNEIGSLRGASLEGYLLYNDLLVQNEDCKYYYRDTYEKNMEWNSAIGRRNTLLTHLSVIEYIQGNAKFSAIMNRFQRGRGVAPITLGSISSITGGIISK
jgi:hypothetical protein